MKTIEEIRKSVLTYCEEVCPNEHNKAHLEVGMLKRQSMGSVFYWLHVDGLSTIAIHENATDDHIFSAYRLLGLEARDAVAAEKSRLLKRYKARIKRLSANDAETHRIQIEVKDERIAELQSRNTALVAAHKDIIQFANNGFKNHDEVRVFARETSRNAIAANTEKGGAND